MASEYEIDKLREENRALRDVVEKKTQGLAHLETDNAALRSQIDMVRRALRLLKIFMEQGD